jgi:hypothetical protein
MNVIYDILYSIYDAISKHTAAITGSGDEGHERALFEGWYIALILILLLLLLLLLLVSLLAPRIAAELLGPHQPPLVLRGQVNHYGSTSKQSDNH